MEHVIIGAGPAGIIAAENIRKLSPSDSVTIIGEEQHPPYSRMALPYLLSGSVGDEGTYLRHGADHYEKLEIKFIQDRITRIVPGNSLVELANGNKINYDRLLVATGSSAIRPPIEGMDLHQVSNCWTLEDAHQLLASVKRGDHVALLGAGFIGCIVLQALVDMGLKLTVIELADRMLARMMDDTGGDMIKEWCENKGVSVKTGCKALGVTQAGSQLEISLSNNSAIKVDHIVCAAGVRPNMAFLDGSGVDTDVGILVDNSLQTSVSNIFAAGDVAQGPDLSTGEQQVHAIQPTAAEHGRVAACQMTGNGMHYSGSLSMNVLNTLGLITSSFGSWDGVQDGERSTALHRGSSRYLRLEFQDDVLVGALAIGLTQHVGVIRGLIQTKVKLGPWKDKLLKDPSMVMNAYLARVQGTRP